MSKSRVLKRWWLSAMLGALAGITVATVMVSRVPKWWVYVLIGANAVLLLGLYSARYGERYWHRQYETLRYQREDQSTMDGPQ